MKRTLLLAASALAAMAIQAKVVTTQQALALAKQFRQAQVAKGGVKAAPMMADMKLAYTANGAEYYVFNGSGSTGYVIVAGDDCAPTILGYSDTGSFDIGSIPPAMKTWLDLYAQQVAVSAKSGIKYAPATDPDHEKIEHMMTTRWNQGAPYNDLCPLDEKLNAHAATGCVATAMAQVVNFHKWPAQAKGTGRAVLNKKIPLTRDMSNDVFEWDKMLDVYAETLDTDSSGTAGQRAAVALLMADMGYGVGMQYSVKGSGALSLRIPTTLIYNFDYDKATHLEYKDWHTEAQWDSIIYNELANNRPVLMSGVTKDNEGHEFVCDGYAGDGFYHFNWGWGGKSDNNFLLSALNPKIQGIGGSSRQLSFDISVDAVIGMQKPQEGSDYVWQFANLSSLYTGIDSQNGEFGIVANMGNLSATSFIGEVGLRVANITTGEVSYVSYEGTSEIGIGSGVEVFPDKLLNGLSDGTYKVSTAYKQQNGEWTPSRTFLEYEKELALTVADGKRTYAIDDTLKTYGIKVNDLLLIKNESTRFGLAFSTNGAKASANIYYALVDTTTNDIVYKSESKPLNIDVNNPEPTIYFYFPKYDIDVTHGYEVMFFEDDDTLPFYAETVRTSDTPDFEVIEPLAISNMVNGSIDTKEEAIVLTMKMRDKTLTPYKSIMAWMATNMVPNDTLLLEEIGNETSISGDTITFIAAYAPEEIMGHEGAEGTINIELPIVYPLIVTPQPANMAQVSFKIASKTGIKDVANTAAKGVTSEVFNMQGVSVAKHNGKACLNNLPTGIYIVKTTDSNGNTKTSKVMAK